MNIELRISNKNAHICGIVTGFMMLAEENKIDLKITEASPEGSPFSALVEAVVDNKLVAFDTMDGYNFDAPKVNEYMKNVDFYFKRSFDGEKNRLLFPEGYTKMYPLGFNYHVTCPGNPCDKVGGMAFLKGLLKNMRGIESRKYFTVEKFEKEADYKKDNINILFYTRMWEPITCHEDWDTERREINGKRVEILRELKRRYPNNFKGAVYNTPSAKQFCPEFIAPKWLISRKNYLKLMKASDICIGSMGLHKSIGWKNAEYIAASRAVVSEKFNYEVIGDYSEGKNHFGFDSIDECIEKVGLLFESPDRLYEMKKANETYYKNYLRPDKQVEYVLKKVSGAGMIGD